MRIPISSSGLSFKFVFGKGLGNLLDVISGLYSMSRGLDFFIFSVESL